jgi:formylglycine-generating enzyme required for sulfatase activity
MDFRLELSLPDPDGPITVRARSEVIGACPPITVPMPFDAAQTSIVARALDLNASDRLRRWFAPNEAQQLREWGVLYTTPPLGESITISGEDIDREPLRMLVRRRLYACLIEPVKPQLEKHLAYLRGQDGAETLHLRLELWPSELTLFQYPWELLHGDDSLDGQIHISRYILDQRHLPPMSAASRLRLLILHSEPSDLEALQLADGERIENGLRPTPGAALVDIQHIEKASIEKLDRALAHDRATPTVVHFAGHGDFGRRCQHCKALTLAAGPNCSACGRRLPKGTVPMGFLAFTDDRSGRTHWISAEELRQALSVARVQLVVLNACKTALGRGGGDCFNGIAQRLMKNVPAVVASPYPLENQGAMDFARKLYEGIGAGDTLVEALQRVRARMRHYEDEWYRPVLYLRSVQDGDETGRLLDLQISARVEPVADRRARVRVRMPDKADTLGSSPADAEQHNGPIGRDPARSWPRGFSVAFSFAGEQRALVRAIARAVEERLGQGTVFLDEWYEHFLAGADADLKLQALYGGGCELVVVCVSARYGGKPWTRVEHEAIRARLMQARASDDARDRDAILPIRVGDGDVDGIPVNAIVPDVRRRSADESADLILARLALIARDPPSPAGSGGADTPRLSATTVTPSPPKAQCSNAETQTLSDALDAAYCELEQRLSNGDDDTAVRSRILELRRRIREGGRLRVGDLLVDGRYKLVERLKQGGFGTIYRAYDRHRHGLVAIKVLHGQYADDRTRIERFFRGARKMAELTHPGIVRVLEPRFDDEGHHFFIMEYLPGGDLRDAVIKGSLASEQTLDLIETLAEVLAYAHAQAVVHRDVKPANIVLDARLNPKLTDFDLVLAGDTTGGTRTGFLGTFNYAAPEALSHAKNVDARADVYGLGMTAVFALLGKEPDFVQMVRDPEAVLSELPTPERLRAVLSQATAWRAVDRFASVLAFRDALREARRAASQRSSRPSSGPDQVAPHTDVDPSSPPPSFRDEFTNSDDIGPEMIWLPGGTFTIGSPDGVGEDREHPAHRVQLSHYAVGRFPVTVGEFRRFVEATGYVTEAEQGDGAWVWNRGDPGNKEDASWRNPYTDQDDNHPVICISWNDAKAYCDWLSEETGQQYGLLSEAQWEYACRAGEQGRWCFGDDKDVLDDYAWYGGRSGDGTHSVGSKRPNAWQLHDMHGNVWEWCTDWFDVNTYKEHAARIGEAAESRDDSKSEAAAAYIVDPTGPETGSIRVVRGGSWDGGADGCRSAYRGRGEPSGRDLYLGFRLSRAGPLHSYPFTLGGETKAPAYQDGLRDPLQDGSQGPAMVWLRGGQFTMGQDDSQWDWEKPAHPVEVSAFSIGQYPLTFDEYDRFCEDTSREKPNDQGWGRGRRPVINISWDDAQAYCNWLNGQQKTGTYRLLTEAEWEFACRAGSETRWSCGDNEKQLVGYAWYFENAQGKTHPVGEKKPNAWQLHDMHGNVWEWCADWFDENTYEERAAPTSRAAQSRSDGRGEAAAAYIVDPTGPGTGSRRVVRGGSWNRGAGDCRSAYRSGGGPSDRYDDLGFRLSRTGSWPSYPFTLVRDDEGAPEHREEIKETPTPQAEPFAPQQGFRDRFVIVRKDGRAERADVRREGPEMVYLPGGTFLMGDEQGNDDEKPVHRVALDAFAMGRTPVTWGEYRRFCEDTDSHWPEWLEEGSQYHLEKGSEDYYTKRGVARDAVDLPVVGVAWDDAVAYCAWLAERTDRPYRLPTEAQWEYACRADTQTRWSFGDDEEHLGDYGWYSKNAQHKLHPVGQKRPNPGGLLDMHGNVWEWCADWYAEDAYSKHAASISTAAADAAASRGEAAGEYIYDPTSPETGSHRVVRGGSWNDDADDCRSACRDWVGPSNRDDYLGFRLSRTV